MWRIPSSQNLRCRQPGSVIILQQSSVICLSWITIFMYQRFSRCSPFWHFVQISWQSLHFVEDLLWGHIHMGKSFLSASSHQDLKTLTGRSLSLLLCTLLPLLSFRDGILYLFTVSVGFKLIFIKHLLWAVTLKRARPWKNKQSGCVWCDSGSGCLLLVCTWCSPHLNLDLIRDHFNQ